MQIERTFDLLENIKQNHNRPDILMAKREGQWVNFSADDYNRTSKHFSYGLLARGFSKGDKIATVSNNRPEWNIADMGMAMAGVIHVPIYPTIGDDEYKHILAHSDAKILIVSDLALYNRLKPIAEELENIEEVLTFNFYQDIPHWSSITKEGEENRVNFKETLLKIRKEISPDDVVSIIYTSGTTGMPKGVMLTHNNFISNVKACAELFDLRAGDRILSFLPISHVFERMVNYLFQYRGCAIYYAENLGTIAQNMVEIQANAFATVPRVIERIYDRIVSKGEDLTGLKKAIFFQSLKLGEKYRYNGKHNPWYGLRLWFARKLVFSKWQKAFGGKLRFVVSGGAALQPRLSRLFFAAGIPLLEGYGLTETSPVIAVNHLSKPNSLLIGTVGPVIENVEVKIDEDGEILTKGPHIMKGYYKDEKNTAEVIDENGWFHTGDIGKLIDNRFLKITDRKKEMFKTSSGKYIAPQVIENMLKESFFIEQAMVVGENEKFASALILPNFEYLHLWAHERRIHFRDNMELISLNTVQKRFQQEIDHYNKQLGKFEQLSRFRLVHEAWTAQSGELSPTLKLRRRVLYKKYADIIRQIYSYNEGEENRGKHKFS
ncbi:AMP-dependent synthetase/ligase [Alkalitalea saponilacus]|uniref:Long-chain acyl-CoA synthetase n=1 Tax=Alkalitalea saponilacus TaxID=889453 RepID=A0A1T5BI10_9BACT|nr:long-chain fatty acid--CoA ligase [Alkalitalea saponilacus]ASB49680.1 long-chain fatty acid--CoA ligase [Alkalitalea saponilacus]SKB46924.1 long-chain acyl-CoA synthetase [Alkalitalea saponilacus]